MKKRMEFLCTTAIFSGILLLLLGILFAAVLSGLRLWMGRQPRQRRRPRGTGRS